LVSSFTYFIIWSVGGPSKIGETIRFLSIFLHFQNAFSKL